MNIHINGEERPLQSEHLLELLQQWGAKPPYAVALNGKFISRDCLAEQVVQTGDRIEVLSPIPGG